MNGSQRTRIRPTTTYAPNFPVPPSNPSLVYPQPSSVVISTSAPRPPLRVSEGVITWHERANALLSTESSAEPPLLRPETSWYRSFKNPTQETTDISTTPTINEIPPPPANNASMGKRRRSESAKKDSTNVNTSKPSFPPSQLVTRIDSYYSLDPPEPPSNSRTTKSVSTTSSTIASLPSISHLKLQNISTTETLEQKSAPPSSTHPYSNVRPVATAVHSLDRLPDIMRNSTQASQNSNGSNEHKEASILQYHQHMEFTNSMSQRLALMRSIHKVLVQEGEQSAIHFAASSKDVTVIVNIAKVLVLDKVEDKNTAVDEIMHPDSAATWLEVLPLMLQSPPPAGDEHALVALKVLRILLPVLEQLVDTAISFATSLGAEVIPEELKKKCQEYKKQCSTILGRIIGNGGLADKKGELGETANELAVSLELFTSKSFPG